MNRAFQLADLGKFETSPNPRVGAVIVHENKIIGEGFHRKYGEAHAEVNAVNAVKNKALLKESTIYVTLEPCSHHGKTPPCVDLLIKHGFKKVVIANTDPFDKVNGSGIAKLKEHGIEVQQNVLVDKGKQLNKRFFCFHQKKRPYIILKWAESKDGFIYKNNSSYNWITNALSKQLVHLWRAEEDAILVGKNTVITDNPELTTREVKGKNPARLIIDRSTSILTDCKIFNDAVPTFILNDQKTDKEFIQVDFSLPLSELVSKFCYERGLQSLIIEGGAKVLQQFIDEDCWDEARIFTGNKNFKEGIKAPIIEGNPVSKEQLIDDQLVILKNKAK